MKQIRIGLGTCGISAGGETIFHQVVKELEHRHLDIEVNETGCMGMCYDEVLLEVVEDEKSYLYSRVTADRVKSIVEEHLVKGIPIEDWIVKPSNGEEGDDFLSLQERIVLRNCGRINPTSIEDYIEHQGYDAIQVVLRSLKPSELIEKIKSSGLRGRGGGGFSTGLKWQFASQSASDKKYIICNADEGDPGAFMDRSVLEGDPHSVIEGMMIGAFAIGADEGYIYVRAEYPLAIKRLQLAIQQCEQRGFLGNNIFGSGHSFQIKIKQGAGAFVCGEETALIFSIEGKRGVPRVRPPFPTDRGLWGKPTCINNVETLANIPWIINHGWEAFAKLGTEKSKGTKVFALAGKIVKSGLAEVPMGMTINEIVFNVGGGVKNGKAFKAVQMGGPSGGCIPASMGDLRIDYDEITRTGAIMGSGGLIVLDETTCMVDLAKFFLNFTQNESCGKCTFCRIGTKRMLEILERITMGQGKAGDIELLESLADSIKSSSLCGLGQTAPNPVLTTIKYFREEYEEHIRNKKCPAHNCPALLTYTIDSEKCTGCRLCARKCPTQAISGESKQVHVIKQESCIQCGQCYDVCRFDAVEKV